MHMACIISAEFGSEWPLPSRIFRPPSPQTSARPYLCTIFQVTMMDVPEPSLVINQRVRRRACLSCTSAKVKCTSASLDAESCRRCERLGKACIYAEPSTEARKHRQETSWVSQYHLLSAWSCRIRDLWERFGTACTHESLECLMTCLNSIAELDLMTEAKSVIEVDSVIEYTTPYSSGIHRHSAS